MAEYIERGALLHDIEQSVVYTAKEKITSAEMRGAHKIIERIKCAPAVEPNEYEKGIITGLRIAETIAEIVERRGEED